MKSANLITRNANNFDFIKILFAWLVIVSHSYVLLGNQGCDWLYEATRHYINFSYFGVKGFITISGYLIFKS
jgi:peptidoglycan/LPS O-acetylase OafA/YrhL